MEAYKNNKGFTLAEMLIVVAIIGVLITIITTKISDSLERAREAVDLANIRNALSEVSIYAITDDQTNMPAYINYKSNKKQYYTFVKATQKKTGWQSSNIELSDGKAVINGATITAGNFSGNNRAYKIFVSTDGNVIINLITTSNVDSVNASDMYYHSNEYVRK